MKTITPRKKLGKNRRHGSRTAWAPAYSADGVRVIPDLNNIQETAGEARGSARGARLRSGSPGSIFYNMSAELLSQKTPEELALLAETAWAKGFLEECPSCYQEALRRSGAPVWIVRTDETGDLVWAVALDDSFWMDAFPLKKEAVALACEMKWPILKPVS